MKKVTLRAILAALLRPYQQTDNRTVRYAFPMLAIFAALLGASAVTTSQQSAVRLEAIPGSVAAGEAFSVNVYVSAHVPVNAVDINVLVPSNVTVTGIDKGQSVITLWTTEPHVERNKVVLRGGTFRKGFIGEHLIATINAEAKSSGLAQFSVTDVLLLAGDGSGTKVSHVPDLDGAKLYVANADGTFSTSESVGVSGAVAVVVITDIDGDGEVSLADISRFMSAWNSKTLVYDFNSDGRMTFRDFGIILSDAFFK